MRRFFHRWLGWHYPSARVEAAGINLASTCEICGKRILQDSQGNWF